MAEETIIDVPPINIRLRRHTPFKPLENLRPVAFGQDGSVLVLIFRSTSEDVEFRFGLDFAAERLVFDVFGDMDIRDTGTADGALAVIDFKRFQNAYVGNGQLEIYDADSATLMSRKDPYIPVNMMFDDNTAKADLDRWEKLAEERRKLEVSGY